MAEYIEREALKEVVSNLRWSNHLNKDAALKLMDRAIDNLPAADVVERKRGEWVINERGFAECTECKFERIGIPLVHRLNFCPNCGADMRGEKHERD